MVRPSQVLLSIAIASIAPQVCAREQIVGIGLYSICEKEPSVGVVIKNASEEPLVIPEGVLPWNNQRMFNFKAFAVRNGRQEVVSTYVPLGDYFREVRVAPTEILIGKLYMSSIVRNFEELHKSSDLFLRYSVNARFGSARFVVNKKTIFIPRRRLFQPACAVVLSETL